MCKKLICLVYCVLVLELTLTGTANAADPSLVGHWTFDEGSGTTAFDSSGNGNDGTITGAEWVTGQHGGALSFTGADYVTVPPEAFSSIEKRVTVAFWQYGDPASQPGQCCSFAAWQTTNNATRQAHGHVPWANSIVYWDTAGTGNVADHERIGKTATPEEYEGSWQHWAFTKDADTGEKKIYLNGVLWHSGTGFHRPMTGVTLFKIGSMADGKFGYRGMIDDFRLYNRALTQEEIQQAMNPELASRPNPGDRETDVVRTVTLNWTPGKFDGTHHDVYFGIDESTVVNADITTAGVYRGRQALDANSYVPNEVPLQWGQTYYWRVDEVNAPDSTIVKGSVWSFTVEPVGYPIAGENITAIASSSNSADEGPENTINGSGLNADDAHSVMVTDMWLSGPGTWIEYEFDRIYKLHQMWVWNYNGASILTSFGLENVTIEYSIDGISYETLGGAGNTHDFAIASGQSDYVHNTEVDFGSVAAKFVKFTVNSNHSGGTLNQYGLSEVRFFYIPVWPREPNPASGATGMGVSNVTLNWRAGRGAASHEVYFSDNQSAVIDETISPISVPAGGSYASYDTGELDLGRTYYWKVTEVNDAETPATWQGDLWSFQTADFWVVDDFESYNDDYESFNRVFQVWIDGQGYTQPEPGRAGNGSGAIVGTNAAPWVEQTIVHSGTQSMPLSYNNTAAPFYSEATRTFDVAQDWTKYGIKSLTLWFHGDPNSDATEQMYVKLNGSKVTYDGNVNNLTRTAWQEWNIDLRDFTGVDLGNVTELCIGFEPSGAVGGSGLMYFDDIRLYPARCRPDVRQPGADLNDDCVVDYLDVQIITNQWLTTGHLVTPVQPSQANLVGHWPLDGDPNDISGNGYHGVATGNVTYGTGVLGSAADFDGSNALINCGDVPVGDTGAISIACWVKPRNISQNWAGYISKWTLDQTQRTLWVGQHSTDGRLAFAYYPYGPTAQTMVDSGKVILANEEWTHIVCTHDGNIQRIYGDGVQVVSSPERNAGIVDRGGNLRLGILSTNLWFNGLMDDVRIYSHALSVAEIASLRGITSPYSESFDLNVDGAVNFKDFAALADEWLDELLWPQP